MLAKGGIEFSEDLFRKTLHFIGGEYRGENPVAPELFAQLGQEELGQCVPIQRPHSVRKGPVKADRLLASLGFFEEWYIVGLACPAAQPREHSPRSPESQRRGNRWRLPARCPCAEAEIIERRKVADCQPIAGIHPHFFYVGLAEEWPCRRRDLQHLRRQNSQSC